MYCILPNRYRSHCFKERQSNAAKPNDGLKPTENGQVKPTVDDEEKENKTEIEKV